MASAGGGDAAPAEPQSILQTTPPIKFGKGTLTLNMSEISFRHLYPAFRGHASGGNLYWFSITGTDIDIYMYGLELRFFDIFGSDDLDSAYFVIPITAQQKDIIASFLTPHKTAQTSIAIPFDEATLIPSNILTRKAFSIDMETTIHSFLRDNCSSVFDQERVPAPLTSSLPSSVLSPPRQQAQGITRVEAQTRRDALVRLLTDCTPPRCKVVPTRVVTGVEKEILVYQRFFTVRDEVFKLAKLIVFNEPGEQEFTYYSVKLGTVEGEGSLHVGLKFYNGQPNFISGNGFYNLLKSESMRGIAVELLCYLLKTIEAEEPWVDHGFRDKPDLFSLSAYGGGPGSQSKAATFSSVIKLVKYYERWGFRRLYLELYPFNTVAFVIENGNLSLKTERRGESQWKSILFIPNVSAESIGQFKRLVEEE